MTNLLSEEKKKSEKLQQSLVLLTSKYSEVQRQASTVQVALQQRQLYIEELERNSAQLEEKLQHVTSQFTALYTAEQEWRLENKRLQEQLERNQVDLKRLKRSIDSQQYQHPLTTNNMQASHLSSFQKKQQPLLSTTTSSQNVLTNTTNTIHAAGTSSTATTSSTSS